MQNEGDTMKPCREVARRISELAALPATEMPPEMRRHLAECARCALALTAERLRRGLLAAAGEAPEPPAGFAARVMGALPASKPSRPETEMWRLGWGLVPAFAVTVVVLSILYQSEVGAVAPPLGLVPSEGLSAGERIVLEASPAELDLVLTAVMEGGGS